MTESGTVSSAESAGAAAGQAYDYLHSGILYDLGLIIAILLVRSVLLGVTARTVSRGSGVVTKKASVFATLFLCFVYVCANPTLQTDDMLRPFGVMALVGVLVCKKAFWLTLEQAFYCSVIFCLLSIFIGDYSRREIDKRYPDRVTVNKSMATAIDAYARKKATIPPTHEPSQDILTALVRMSTLTNAGVLTDMLGFVRAGLEAKAEMERLQKIAAQEAMIADMLGGGGGRPRNRAQEMSALQELFGPADPNAPKPPPMPIREDDGKRRHGYMETYAEAKATLAEVNRIASNNAAIVNMLSGIGEQVTDRRAEMDKLHAALLEEAMKGGIDLSPAGEALSEEQIASLQEAMSAAGGGEDKTNVLDQIYSGDMGTNAAPAKAMTTTDIQKTIEELRAVAAAASTERDHLRKTLLQEAMLGKVDMSVGGAPVTEEQIARIRKAMETAGASDTNAVDGASTNAPPAQDVSPAEIQAALDAIRKDTAVRISESKKLSAARAKAKAGARTRAVELFRYGALPSWNGPYFVRIYRDLSSYRFMRADAFDHLRRQYRAPWEGSLWAVGAAIVANPVDPAAPVAASARSELVVVRAKPTQAAKPPPPSPYELLSKEDRAKWDKALQKIEVTGVVGSSANLAAIVNGSLLRQGETVFVDVAGTNYSFRLLGIGKKGKCQWEPLVGPKKTPASVTVTF